MPLNQIALTARPAGKTKDRRADRHQRDRANRDRAERGDDAGAAQRIGGDLENAVEQIEQARSEPGGGKRNDANLDMRAPIEPLAEHECRQNGRAEQQAGTGAQRDHRRRGAVQRQRDPGVDYGGDDLRGEHQRPDCRHLLKRAAPAGALVGIVVDAERKPAPHRTRPGDMFFIVARGGSHRGRRNVNRLPIDERRWRIT